MLNGTNPFKADRKPLHPILIDLGLPVGKAVALIHLCGSTAAAQQRRLNGGAFVLGGIGAAGWFWGVADYVMFYAAMVIFAAHLVFCAQALRLIDARRR